MAFRRLCRGGGWALCVAVAGAISCAAEPGDPWAWLADEPWTAMESEAETGPTADRLARAYEAERDGDFTLAARRYAAMVREFPDAAEPGADVAIQRLALCLDQMWRYEQAARMLTTFAQVDPARGNAPELQRIVLIIAAKLADRPTALPRVRARNRATARAIAETVAAADTAPAEVIDAGWLAGALSRSLGEPDRARAAWTAIRDRFPDAKAMVARVDAALAQLDGPSGPAARAEP